MGHYRHPAPAAVTATDDFAASRTRLEAMIAHLGSVDMMGCSQQMLEEYVTTAGRELQRQLMQVTLSLRVATQA
jgi:hypothetical protein